jgi:lipopolysaccharide/colanic/teichoic acid biosynthesis glycosyltransferase
VFDIAFSSVVLLIDAPILLLIAIAIKLDSHGPILYLSECIGRKGRIFRCIKFRTMVSNVEKRRTEMIGMNEREEELLKMTTAPCMTRLGQFLRQYSLDELPQLLNVLYGDMSIVGPRPTSAGLREYKLSNMRHLDVSPGITGLWQVQRRPGSSIQSPNFLDETYAKNLSIWLDLKIILRTIFRHK